MAVNLKSYLYSKGSDTVLDSQFASATSYARAKLGSSHIFWKAGFRWYCIPIGQVRRIFRREMPVRTKLCCGGANFTVEWMVLILSDGSELEIYMGDDVQTKAEAMLQSMKGVHPQIQYGKA